MQGVVYGTRTREINETGFYTRFDIDEVWGTAMNRFCVQAVLGIPITAYGKGDQRRGFLSLEDSISCLMLGLEKPAGEGEYRVYNQFDEHYSINEIAQFVKDAGESILGRNIKISHVENPRVEKDQHYYNPEHRKLRELGYHPSRSLKEDVNEIISDIQKFRDTAERYRSSVAPKTYWKESSGLRNQH